MFVALVVMAFLLFFVAALQWRSRRAAVANRWLHAIVGAMEALENGRAIHAPNLPQSTLLGSSVAQHIKSFYATACDPAPDSARAQALGDAVLRELRDISTHREHKWVSRA